MYQHHFVHHKSHTDRQVMDSDLLIQRSDPRHGPKRHVLQLQRIIVLVLFMKSLYQTNTVTQNQVSATYLPCISYQFRQLGLLSALTCYISHIRSLVLWNRKKTRICIFTLCMKYTVTCRQQGPDAENKSK